jgi:hypothetical protein
VANSDDVFLKSLGVDPSAASAGGSPVKGYALGMSPNIGKAVPGPGTYYTGGVTLPGQPTVAVDKAGGSGADGRVFFFEEALVNGEVKKNVRLVLDLGKVIYLSVAGVSLPVQQLTAMKLNFDDHKPKSLSPGVKQMSLGMVGQVPGVWTEFLPVAAAPALPTLTFSIKPPPAPVGVVSNPAVAPYKHAISHLKVWQEPPPGVSDPALPSQNQYPTLDNALSADTTAGALDDLLAKVSGEPSLLSMFAPSPQSALVPAQFSAVVPTAHPPKPLANRRGAIWIEGAE